MSDNDPMSDKVKPDEVKSEAAEVVQQLRTKEPEAPPGADEPNPSVVTDEVAGEERGEHLEPGSGGYMGRDVKKDMPVVPGVPSSTPDS
jgi:hypothetical protein